ncbi:MAG: hypothetical protein JSV33_04655 [bacterium]|nr:MAG: hypothetical protein JSV33_04655 [bacterium]
MASYFEPINLTRDEIEALHSTAPLCDAYRFLDLKVLVHSDDERLLDIFRQMYRHFLSTQRWGWNESHSYYILSRRSDGGVPLLLWDADRAYGLPRGKGLSDCADIVIFANILSKITTHFMIHGAALAAGSGAVVLAGLSGAGKTTLALELARRGLGFFSDEIAAISRTTHDVYPFPRAIGTRERTMELLGTLDFRVGRLHHTAGGKEKWVVDIEDIFDAPPTTPVPGRYLLLLDTASVEGDTDKDYHYLKLALKRADTDLIEKLGGIDGVAHGRPEEDGIFYTVGCRVERSRDVQQSFLDLCREYDEVILYRVKAVEHPPDARAGPELVPVATMDAGLELLSNLQNMVANDGWLMQEASGKNPRVLFELLDSLAGMACYRLYVGNLTKTADLVMDLVSAGK